VHTVLAVDAQGRFLDGRYHLSYEQSIAAIGEFGQKYGPDARILVDGRDATNQAQLVTKPATMEKREVQAGSEFGAAELGVHILWESYERASQIQATMADRMIGQSVEMTRRFAEEMEGLRQRYSKALLQIDGIAFEQRMFEHERSYQHIAQQHRQLAEDERRAATRTDVGGLVEQLVVGAVRIIKAIGDEDARCSAEEAPKDTNR
jgi:hypothetical protein